MKLSLFYELTTDDPNVPGAVQQRFNEALEQCELADQMGFTGVWCVEHHFLPGYSSMSSPELFLAAVSQLVHGGTITAAQGRILVADIRAGRVDPEQLVARGTLTRAQMGAVMERLGAVKRSLAPGAHAATRTK